MKNKIRIISLAVFMCIIITSISVCGVSATESDFKYKEEIYSVLDIDRYPSDIYEFYYSEIYEHYPDTSSADEATPDYVLVSLHSNMFLDLECAEVFGDYIIRDNNGFIPYPFFYYAYTPSDGKVYTLREAFDMNFDGINEALAYCPRAELIGDVNYDGTLNIKDATLIQKQLADLEEIVNDKIRGLAKPGYVSDFNRDGERNIKDATAIQKHIAGLEY